MSLFSVNTNVSAMAALQSLDATQMALNQAQNEVSTGQKVAQASDDPAIYAIANSINANIAGLSAVSDSLNFGAQVVATASSAVSSVNSVLQSLQQTVTSSNTSGENLTTLQNQVASALQSINQYATAATFSGVNLLVNTAPSGGSNSLNVVQSVDGSVYTVNNQINPTPGSSTNQSLTDALGLTGLSVSSGAVVAGDTIPAYANIGANIAFGSGTTVGSQGTAGTFQSGTAGTNIGLQITVGATGGQDAAATATTAATTTGNTYTFEFNDTAVAAPLQSYNTSTVGNGNIINTNTTIAVNFNSTTDSTDQVVADLAAALTANGFGVVQQPDGSLNIVGQGITQVAFGTLQSSQPGFINALSETQATQNTNANNEYTSATGAATGAGAGVTVSSLLTNQTAVTTVTAAVQKLNAISASLGAATQQITGIQNFTTALSSALTAGVGALTDADLAAESAQLTSLQTKQQLAAQSLTIANQQPQTLLTLFKNA
jgi:flagellin